MADKHWLKKLWDNYAGVFHVIGLIIVLIFVVGGHWRDFEAYGDELNKHDARITALERNYVQIDQKLDDIMTYLHVPMRPGRPY